MAPTKALDLGPLLVLGMSFMTRHVAKVYVGFKKAKFVEPKFWNVEKKETEGF